MSSVPTDGASDAGLRFELSDILFPAGDGVRNLRSSDRRGTSGVEALSALPGVTDGPLLLDDADGLPLCDDAGGPLALLDSSMIAALPSAVRRFLLTSLGSP